MARMLEMIRNMSAPPAVMRSAARGALSIAPVEMLEILVFLATDHGVDEWLGVEARQTLAKWDERSTRNVLSNPGTSDDVLNFFTDLDNFRESFLPSLLQNPSVTDDMLVRLAARGSSNLLSKMVREQRVAGSSAVLSAIKLNLQLAPDDLLVAEAALERLERAQSKAVAEESTPAAQEPQGTVVDYDMDAALDEMIALYEKEHAEEIAAEEGKPFQLVEAPASLESTSEPEEEAVEEEEEPSLEKPPEQMTEEELAAMAASIPELTPEELAGERAKESVYQKIAAMKVGDRVQLALKGSKEERAILIRDGAKVVSQAVLDSPRLTDPEVEVYANMKNVSDIVLRVIASRRKFIRNYTVVKNLVNNPRTPLDVGLTLMKNLVITDLRALTMNKNVSDVLRKMSIKLYRQRARQH